MSVIAWCLGSAKGLRWFAHLVVAGLEVEVLDKDSRVAAPIAAEQGVTADQVQRARHDVTVRARPLPRHDQQDLLAHGFADAVEELPRQVRLTPLVVCAGQAQHGS